MLESGVGDDGVTIAMMEDRLGRDNIAMRIPKSKSTTK